jgi:ATP-dependent Lon protease
MEENSEEKVKLTNTIYEKYIELKDADYNEAKRLEDAVTDRSIIKKIVKSEHNDNVKSILLKKYKFYENKENSSEEFAKTIEWIDTVLDIPTRTIEHSPTKKSDIGYKLKKLSNFLSDKIYGLDKVKDEIIKIMFSRIINPNGKNGKILMMVGPPGVGKTAIAETIAEAMDLPFGQISFGSTHDSSRLSGHARAWVGAGPGDFAKILIKAKRLDSLVLLDEIDKITNTNNSNITNVLIHALDKSQNHRFKDDYIPEVPLDLSQIIFLCSANNIDNVDPILRDRLAIINLSGYSIKEKVEIARRFLISKFKKEYGLDDNEVIITDTELEYLISKKTADQPGMRDVERKLGDFFCKLSMQRFSKDIKLSIDAKIKFPVKITTSIIDKLL